MAECIGQHDIDCVAYNDWRDRYRAEVTATTVPGPETALPQLPSVIAIPLSVSGDTSKSAFPETALQTDAEGDLGLTPRVIPPTCQRSDVLALMDHYIGEFPDDAMVLGFARQAIEWGMEPHAARGHES